MERDWKKKACREREKKKTAKIFEETITKWTTHLFVISEPWVHFQKFRSDSEVQ